MIQLVISVVFIMVSLVISEVVDTTWAFIRMIEHWNQNEWWRRFNVETPSKFPGIGAITLAGEVSTEGRIRHCDYGLQTRRDNRSYFDYTNMTAYQIALSTFILKPQSLEVLVPDHKNRNSMDNRVANLRWSTYTLNQLNRRDMFDENNQLKSGVGVTTYQTKSCGVRYRARIGYKGGRVELGIYDTMQEADDVYRRAWRDMFEILM